MCDSILNKQIKPVPPKMKAKPYLNNNNNNNVVEMTK